MQKNVSLILIALFSLLLVSQTSLAAESSLLSSQNIDFTVQQIVQEILKPLQSKGEVVKVKGNQVYLNLGAKNVKKGQKFRIVGMGEELIDPSTNRSLGYEQHYRCTVEVFEVTENYSIAQIVGEITEVIQEKDQALPLSTSYKLAVTQFSLPSNYSVTLNEAVYLQEKLIIAFSKETNIDVVERDQLDRVLEEYKLSNSGLIDESTATELGRLLGVNALIIGNFVSWGDNDLELTAKMVDIQTGVILSAAQINAKDQLAKIDALNQQATEEKMPERDKVPSPQPTPTPQLPTVGEEDVDLEIPKDKKNNTQINVVVIGGSSNTETTTPPVAQPAPVHNPQPVPAPAPHRSRFIGEWETGISNNKIKFDRPMEGFYFSERPLQHLESYLEEGPGFYTEMNLWPAKWFGIGAGYDLVYSSFAQDNFDAYNQRYTEKVSTTLGGPYGQILVKISPILVVKAGMGYYLNSYTESIKYTKASSDYYSKTVSGHGPGILFGAQLTTPPLWKVSFFFDATYRQAVMELTEEETTEIGVTDTHYIFNENKWIDYSGLRLSGGLAIHF